MNRFLIFIILVVIIAIVSLFVHEAAHFVCCLLVGGIAKFFLFSPISTISDFGFLGIFGGLGVSCSVVYFDVFIREAIAYSVQGIFAGVLSLLAFKWVVLS